MTWTTVGVVGLVFGSCVFVLVVAGIAFNAGANLVKSHYMEDKRKTEGVDMNVGF